LAQLASSISKGSTLRLFILICITGAAISTLLANDTTAVVLTPIVYTLVLRLSLDPLPFMFATTFIADTASIGLPVSNPINLIISEQTGIDLPHYISAMWLPSLLVIVVNIILFTVLFRRELRTRYSVPPKTGASSSAYITIIILMLIAITYICASYIGWPLGIVSVIGAAILAVNLAKHHKLSIKRLREDISWSIFPFITGLVIVVEMLRGIGITDHIGRFIIRAAGTSLIRQITVTTLSSMIGTNLFNNLPMALIMTRAINDQPLSVATKQILSLATILGCDLGPNLTHFGSLANFLWLFFLRKEGVEISAVEYAKLGVVTVPFLLAAAILGLWITIRFHLWTGI